MALGEDFPLWTSQAAVESLVGEGEVVGLLEVEGSGTEGFSGVSYQLSQRLAGQP